MSKASNTKNNWLELMAQKLAEVRLSEIGFRFLHGVYPAWRHVKQVVESKAYIVRLDKKGQGSLTPEKAMLDGVLNGVKELEKRKIKP